MDYKTLRKILLALSLGDTERAHWLASHSLAIVQQSPSIIEKIELLCKVRREFNPVNFCGIPLKHPLGAAGGVDKNGIFLLALQAFGFSHVDVGTVLPRPQYGNPKPRLFRIEEQEALINRFSFNSAGAHRVAANIRRQQWGLKIPLGGNVGRMKDTSNEMAAADYAEAMAVLRGLVTYWVWNISSPNTPGLRELQGGKYLENFLRDLVQAKRLLSPNIPCVVKIAPDLTEAETDEVADTIVMGANIDGVIIGNTTLQRPGKAARLMVGSEAGGYSGPELFPITFRVAERFRKRYPDFPMAFAGGVNASNIRQALDVAHIVQVNTTFGFRGPPGNREMLEALPN